MISSRGGVGMGKRGGARGRESATDKMCPILRNYRFYHILGEASGMKATLIKGDQENIALSIIFFPIVFSDTMT